VAVRYLGIDLGAETVKVVELTQEGSALRWTRRALVEHPKDPGPALLELLSSWDWPGAESAAVCGRLGRQVTLPRVPTKQAMITGHRFLRGDLPATLVSIGSHGFSVLELRGSGTDVFRENSRCSQGTGNFLRQLVERFGVDIQAAAELASQETAPAPLSGRCPVILKTDMTHLANKGESRARILAGLFDAVCENVQVLIKPQLSPPDVILLGGVQRAERVRSHFRSFLEPRGMRLVELPDDDVLFIEALGCAVVASERRTSLPALERLIAPPPANSLEVLPPLARSLGRVRRLTEEAPRPITDGSRTPLVLGFDIGSTGSKAVALDVATGERRWDAYLRTSGDPVGAAQALMKQFQDSPVAAHPVVGLGATGSGREIVGSLLTTCYGGEVVCVMNEIAAHAEGAIRHDPRVDTIFEIGGQDAKYIRLVGGRVVDAAMNEACSAGTGSFIEEQGKRFAGLENVAELGQEALRADSGVALGQHCSVFMAEIIDEAVASGVPRPRIVAGIYDSIIQNYLNRVKGSRSVGQVIFCQGMPFASDALAAAVARQTGSEVIVPPNPGLTGALGIALMARKELALPDLAALKDRPALDPARFLEARVAKKDTFVCNAVTGCGGAGNKCRIDRLLTVVEGQQQRFTWGGGCSLYDKGARRKKLPDRSPDPFRQRAELVAQLAAEVGVAPGRPRVAMTDEFTLKGLFPFFATFIHRLGFEVAVTTGADRTALRRGIEEASIPFCAPLQHYRGLVSRMAEEGPSDRLFLPMLREMPQVKDEPRSVLCPMVQGSTDMLRFDLGARVEGRVISPVIDVGPGNLDAPVFLDACKRLASDLGIHGRDSWRAAWEEARAAQNAFDAQLLEHGREALDFCARAGVLPVVVVGRTYSIANDILNSNVPAILREQGALAIPLDCYPVDDDVPVIRDMFWANGQRILRAAHQIRRTPGVYGIFCSNYSCGPDSFTSHFFAYAMEGKPFAVIETDGHSGDAGTKTRVEAFLHCVREDLSSGGSQRAPTALDQVERRRVGIRDVIARGERVIFPRMGPAAEPAAAAMRGMGIPAEVLPVTDRDAVRLGRRNTSGKECIPMTITLGGLLQRLERSGPDERFAFMMPGSRGPCRFGAYQLLHKISLERLGLKDRVSVWSPPFENYFEGFPPGFKALVFTALMGNDLMQEALFDVRPVERHPGAAEEIHQKYMTRLLRLTEEAGAGDLSGGRTLLEAASGRLYGIVELLDRAAAEMAAVAGEKEVPTVLIVGEIFVRCDPFSNDYVVDRLEERGIRARLAPVSEWIEFSDLVARREGRRKAPADRVSSFLQGRIQERTYDAVARHLDWPRRTRVSDSLRAGRDYVRERLEVETPLTIGGAVHEWRQGIIDAVISVGPLECMPNKIAESQFFHVAEREGLPSLTLSLNGDPVDPEILDNFAFEVHAQFARRRSSGAASRGHFAERTRRLLAELGRGALSPVTWPLERLVALTAPGGKTGEGEAEEPN
jgi:activator of 2-hydroxyglutaryl-CoA dehydratase/predicted nucleotide-binding protein (sugar kinase/HSP70/actin superfamily)